MGTFFKGVIVAYQDLKDQMHDMCIDYGRGMARSEYGVYASEDDTQFYAWTIGTTAKALTAFSLLGIGFGTKALGKHIYRKIRK